MKTSSATRHELRLSRASRRLMFVEAQAAAAHELEIGGGLYGASSFSGKTSVHRAGTPGASTRATASSLTFNYDDLETDECGDSRLIGFWHSHPRNSEVGLSRADIEAFSRMKNQWRTVIPRFVAVVVTPDPRAGWDKPHVNAWRFHMGEKYGRSVVLHEPVEISLYGDEPDPWPSPSRVKIPSELDVDTGVTLRSRAAAHTSHRRPRRAATQYGANAWMVATRDFTATYYGTVDHITAGNTYIRAGHDLVKRYPDAWRYDRERTEHERRQGGPEGHIRYGGPMELR